MTDQRWMRRCLELAEKALGRTAPNPMVGSVIVGADGELISEGYHPRAGEAHAEVVALEAAGERARGATLYVSLEPCNHQGRTGPCAVAVAEAGVARVVYGADDPVEGHQGGAEYLREHGVEVVGGVLGAESARLNRGFFSVAQRGRPWVVGKAAMSLDGKIATRTGESKWITGEEARLRGRQLRDQLDGIMVGIGTVLADDPRLTSRTAEDSRDPVRVIVDSTLRTPSSALALPANSVAGGRCVIACMDHATGADQQRLESKGAEIWRLPHARTGKIDLRALCERLAVDAGLTTVLVEGGGQLMASSLAEGLIDELWLFVAPLVIGGDAPAWVGGQGASALADAHRFAPTHDAERIGDDWLLRFRPT